MPLFVHPALVSTLQYAQKLVVDGTSSGSDELQSRGAIGAHCGGANPASHTQVATETFPREKKTNKYDGRMKKRETATVLIAGNPK